MSDTKPVADDIIEFRARQLQLEMWNERTSLWPEDAPSDPVDALQPGVALCRTGFQVLSVSSLGIHDGGRVEPAGQIDRDNKVVKISARYPYREQRFTAAHELGHAILHPFGGGIHRDKPISGYSVRRTRQEYEADRFAAHFLMPRKQVLRHFNMRFGCTQFVLNELTGFALLKLPLLEARRCFRDRRALALHLAKAEEFNGTRFTALATRFQVTPCTMAIQLEEFGCI